MNSSRGLTAASLGRSPTYLVFPTDAYTDAGDDNQLGLPYGEPQLSGLIG